MRNLKKFLALVLAMMMAFSLMVTANAANEADNGSNLYGDTSSIDATFVEAVDVLYGMGIMTGDNGNFYGDRNVMRSEMTAVLYRLMTGDTSNLKSPLYASIAAERFNDVKESDWFAPYVGWCYDAGLVNGYNGYFRPWSNVTGYETLVMVLRTMGYGKNGEYIGQLWSVNASSDGTTVGLLKDVNRSHYANTLSQYTRRDVVASIVFQAAQLPTVTYSPSLGYNKYVGVAVGTGGNILNDSLGMKNFGLTSHYGIVVGNQATGEKYTKIGFSVDPTFQNDLTGTSGGWVSNMALVSAKITDDMKDAAYSYASGANSEAKNVTLAFDWNTNLKLFNHAVKVWYDCRGDGQSYVSLVSTATDDVTVTGKVDFPTNNKTYALYDKATATGVVTANDTALNGTAAGNLAKKVALDSTGVHTNYAFAAMDGTRQAIASGSVTKSPVKANNNQDGITGATTDWPLYLWVSNSADKAADVVITLNLTISQVVQDNNTKAPLTTGITTQNGAGSQYFDKWDLVDPTATGDHSTGTPTAAQYSNIANDDLVDSDDIFLRDYVSAVTVTGTAPTQMNGTADATATTTAAPTTVTGGNAKQILNSNYYYKVNKLTEKVTKTLQKYDPATQTVYFMDGSSLDRSIYALAVDGSFQPHSHVMAPSAYGEYTFYLDEEGNWLFWEQAAGSATFVYGTYIDWETKTASSTFDYPMVYVTTSGETKQVKNLTQVVGKGLLTGADANTTYNSLDLPKRDTNTTYSSSGYIRGDYIGYQLTSAGVATPVTDSNSYNTGFFQANNTNFGTASSVTVVDANGIAIGAVPVANRDTSNNALGINANNLFLTEDTVFIIVDGAGTDNQTADVRVGLKALVGEGNSSVKIDATTALVVGSNAGKYLDDNSDPYKMIYFSSDAFRYGQTYDPSAKAVQTVFIPKQLITWTASATKGDLYFVGDNSYTLIDADNNATLYTMYKDGVEGSYWIEGKANTDAAGASGAAVVRDLNENVFYKLVATGDKAYDGGMIYELQAMTADEANDTIIGHYYQTVGGTPNTTTPGNTTVMANSATSTGYLATTYSAQVAYVGGRNGNFLYNVGSANVKNLNEDYTINSLTDLNNASSLTSNTGIEVSCVLSSDLVIGLIYVNYAP